MRVEWPAVASILSVMGTIVLGVLTYVRGTKADDALNKATTVEATFEAQRQFIDNLQEEVMTTREQMREYRTDLTRCERDCRECRGNLAGAHLIIRAQEAEIENLKGVVGEHERTIANHERSLNVIRRRGDQTKRQDDEERRKP